MQLKSPHFSRFVNALTEQLLCMAARGGEISKSSAVLGKPEIEDTIRYLQANYREPFSVEAWAEQHHISVCWFIRKFRERTGMTPLQYLTRLRIQKAKELLQYLDQIGTVAELVGYSDPLYFSRIFKSRTGVSPTEYRKQIAGR
ncbi:MAG TPA: helix-turn-helix transcriptional regulator [Clostridiales bacterium]|nr:helix-turn-helix transcriptional regulator [Clostridiales bacterium]